MTWMALGVPNDLVYGEELEKEPNELIDLPKYPKSRHMT